jgi:ribonuclease HI
LAHIANQEGASRVTADQVGQWSAFMMERFGVSGLQTPEWEEWRSQGTRQPIELKPPKSFEKASELQKLQPRVVYPMEDYVDSLPKERPLRFDSKALVYTDGSKKGAALGAGIYDGPGNKLLALCPTGHAGQLNTVPKAEGTAILAALQQIPAETDVTILTDSLTFIQMLQSMLHNPTRYRVHKHKHLIKRIVNLLLSRTGSTTFYKVRAHVGVAGNELADKAAKIAAEAQTSEDRGQQEEELQAAYHGGDTLLAEHEDAVASRPGLSASWLQYVQQPDQAEGEPELWDFDELKHHVADWVVRVAAAMMHARFLQSSVVYSRLHGMIVALAALPVQVLPPMAASPSWLAPGPYTVDPASCACLSLDSQLQWGLVRLATQIRWEQFWTRKRAHKLYPGKYQSPMCQLCLDRQETIGHYFGGCTHQLMHKMACKRHGKTVMHMVKAIQAGSLGDRALFHDSEAGDRSARAMPGAIPRRRGESIPDVVFLPNVEPHRLYTDRLAQLSQQEKTIVLIEVGHCTDARLAQEVEEKIRQHFCWAEYLRGQGWSVKYFPVAVAHSGLVTSTLAASLRECGVKKGAAAAAVARVIKHTLDYNCKFRSARKRTVLQIQDAIQDPG